MQFFIIKSLRKIYIKYNHEKLKKITIKRKRKINSTLL